jgi:cytochrome b
MNTRIGTLRRITAARPTRAGRAGRREDMVKVWDPLVRLFHWSLVAGIAGAWLTADEWDRAHELIGYAIAALVAIRLVWGFIGTPYARFAQFVKGPRETLAYLGRILRGGAERHLGHNPAGAAMIVALLTTIAGTVLTGWMMTLDAFWGADWLEDLHEALATFILVLVGFHVAGVIHASVAHRENLIRAMITGRKRR